MRREQAAKWGKSEEKRGRSQEGGPPGMSGIFYFHSPFARRGPIVYSIIFPSNEAGSCVCLVARIES